MSTKRADLSNRVGKPLTLDGTDEAGPAAGAEPTGDTRPERAHEASTFSTEAVPAPGADPGLSPVIAALKHSIDHADFAAIKAALEKRTAETIAALMATYRAETGRDLEYDLRGFPPAVDLNPFDGDALRLRGGLRGAQLQQALELLHGPAMAQLATRLAVLVGRQPLDEAANAEVYRSLTTLGGEARALLAKKFEQATGKSFVRTMQPLLAAAAKANDARPLPDLPQRSVAVVVSSGNWAKVLDGSASAAVGGYHWREIEAYVKEALDNHYTPVFFTPDGLPASPDSLSLLQGKLGPTLGFGLRAGTGPEDSAQGRAIIEGLTHPRSMASCREQDFATLHVAGGHGSAQDLVGHPEIARAALELNANGKIVDAVCHATPSLGRGLLEGSKATGFSPQYDQVMLKAGFVLPEFHPPYDAHAGLRQLGAHVSTLGALDINHTETFSKNGVPVVTGTGPEATDNVAKAVFRWLAENRPMDSVPRFQHGPEAGKPVDIALKNSVRQLSSIEAEAFHPKPGEIVLQGFQHEGRYFTAVVPANAVQRVDFHTEHYPDPIPFVDVGAHNQLVFHFDSDVKLYANGPAAQPSLTLREAIYSVEGLNAVGEKPFDAASVASLIAGKKQTFVTAYRMVSVE